MTVTEELAKEFIKELEPSVKGAKTAEAELVQVLSTSALLT